MLENTELHTLLAEIVGEEHVVLPSLRPLPELENSLGVVRDVLGVVFPADTAQVRRLVSAAAAHAIPLYPISRGMNRGYGEMVPVQPGQLIVNLRRMNRVRSFDPRRGLIEVEPGVTQGDLCRFLQAQGNEYFFDATGASADASVVGNTLEGGFGFTPLGNRRRAIVEIEAVLGNGDLLTTGQFPGIGPDLSGLFVQSNFAVVTALTCRVLPRPPRVESILLELDDERSLGQLIETLAALRQRGIIENIPHIANAIRAATLSQPFEAWNKPAPLTLADARRMLRCFGHAAGSWNGILALYGSRNEIRYRRRIIREALRGIARVHRIDERRLGLLTRFSRAVAKIMPASAVTFERLLTVLGYLHDLAQGVPAETGWEAAGWRIADDARRGLLLHPVVFDPTQHDVATLLTAAKEVFGRFEFDMPVTMTVIDSGNIVCTFSIAFDKGDKSAWERAYAAYHHLTQRCGQQGFPPSRLGILNAPRAYYPPSRAAALHALKQQLDPHNIIAPGRYGLGS